MFVPKIDPGRGGKRDRLASMEVLFNGFDRKTVPVSLDVSAGRDPFEPVSNYVSRKGVDPVESY
ncbi:MAG: hypothetical protein ACYCYP_12210 [Leptospirales bacterium]